MFKVENLTVRAGSFSVKGVSLKVADSSCHVIVGPTGSGKTLLLETILGLRHAESGRILLNGEDITLLPIEKRSLAYVPQDLALFPHMTAEDNILYGARIRKGNNGHVDELLPDLLNSLGITHILKRSIRNLSGGERQRTALARAVASGSKFLILDEPLSSLHESLKRELWSVLKDLQYKYGLALLMVTHDLEEAFFMGEDMTILVNGRILQQGPKSSVYMQPHNQEVAGFLGVSNMFRSVVTEVDLNSVSMYSAELDFAYRSSRLDTILDAQDELRMGEEVLLGIRAHDFEVICRAGNSSEDRGLIAGGVRRILDTGKSFQVSVSVNESGKTLDVEVSRRRFHDLALNVGDTILIRINPNGPFMIRLQHN